MPTVNLPGYDSHRAFHTKHMTFLAPDPNESFILKTIAQSQSMASSKSVDSTLTISSAIKAGVWESGYQMLLRAAAVSLQTNSCTSELNLIAV